MCHIFMIPSTFDGRLGCIHFLSTVNRVAINMDVQMSLWYNKESKAGF